MVSLIAQETRKIPLNCFEKSYVKPWKNKVDIEKSLLKAVILKKDNSLR